MDSARLFVKFIVAFFGGIFMGDLFLEQEYLKMGVLFLGMGIVVLKFFGWGWRVILVVLMGLLFGFFRFVISFEQEGNHIKEFGGYVQVRACICEEVDVRVDKVKYVMGAEVLLQEGIKYQVEGRFLVNAARYPVYEYGDCFVLEGMLEEPEAFEGFAYDKYLARYGIYMILKRPRINKLSDEMGVGFFYEKIFWLKGVFEKRLSQIYAEPHASFMAGLILGSRKGIPDKLMEDFNTTGLTHIIAISGYNITLLIVIVANFLGFLGRRAKVAVSIVVIVLFVILVGGSAAVVRAAIMGGISLVAIWYGRVYAVGSALFIAAFMMNLWNPKILLYDVGFQLSFLATCGLVYVSPLLEKYFLWLPKFLEIRESVLMTISAQVLALPVILLNFERLSIVSPLANLFVLPFIPLAMIFGFFGTLFTIITEIGGSFIAFGGYVVLEVIIFFVGIFARVPLASVELGWFNGILFWGYYWIVLGKVFYSSACYQRHKITGNPRRSRHVSRDDRGE